MKRLWLSTLIAALATQTALLAADQQPPVPKAAIAALPNPVPADPNVRGTTISWTTGSGVIGEVRVSVNGGPEQLFAQGQSGSSAAEWITAKNVFEFRLYPANDPKQVLASVKVTREEPSGARIEANPNPVPAGTGLATTVVTWATGDQSPGEVYVSRSGEPERLFAKGPSGSSSADWIDRAASYEFKLYATTPSKRLLATATLKAAVATPASKPGPGGAADGSRNLFAYVLWAAVVLLLVIAVLRLRRKPEGARGS